MMTVQKKLGQYYTRPELVDAMLNMIGYRADQGLYKKRILEPSTGDGAFLFLAINRLIQSVKRDFNFLEINKESTTIVKLLKDSLRAIELDDTTYKVLKEKVTEHLCSLGLKRRNAEQLSDYWIVNDDFLMWNTNYTNRFDFVLGNPPFIRIENLDTNKIEMYRLKFETLFDRSDIYVAFIEHGLKMLSETGTLSYICTDRFTKNHYGKKIRSFISHSFRVKYYIDIHNTQPFLTEVSAYPCIFAIDRKHGDPSTCLVSDSVEQKAIQEIVDFVLLQKEPKHVNGFVKETWFESEQPWIMEPDIQQILKKIQSLHPSIKNSPGGVKCKVGVATGANSVFLVSTETINKYELEEELLVPIITKKHIKNGEIKWDGLHVINTFGPDKKPVDINNYPNTKTYFNNHGEALRKRAFVLKRPEKWYYTQEKVRLEEIETPKLLFPDIALGARIIIEDGSFYPEHSLYYLLAGEWNLQTLKIIMESPVALAFVIAYSTKMRGDYVRFQKQSVEKICLPTDMSTEIEKKIHSADASGDRKKLNNLLQQLYQLNDDEMNQLISYVIKYY